MKKINWVDVLIVFTITALVVMLVALIGCSVVPLFIRLAKDMWLLALA